jgi:hypothetical protein
LYRAGTKVLDIAASRGGWPAKKIKMIVGDVTNAIVESVTGMCEDRSRHL